MKIIKGLVLSLLGLLLFLALSFFGLAFTLKSTVLNPDFIKAEVVKLDIPSLARDLNAAQFVGQLLPEIKLSEETVYAMIAREKPWLEEQASFAVDAAYDYLLGESERLAIVIPLQSLKEDLREVVWQSFRQDVPPQLAGLPPEQLRAYFDQYYQQYAELIPSSITVEESDLGTGIMNQLVLARQIISYFSLVYYGLLGLMIVLALLIILIHRNVRGAARDLGITLLSYGAIEFAGVFLGRSFLPGSLPVGGLPASLEIWLLDVSRDLLAPLQAFSLGVLVGGVVLLIVSLVYSRRTDGEGMD